MKKVLCFVLLIGAVLLNAAAPLPPIDYTNPANWAIYTPAAKADKGFDIFYIYPTLVADKNIPLMQWDEKIKAKVIPFAEAQLSGFKNVANLYCPYVRQLEFYRCMEELKGPLTSNEAIKTPPAATYTSAVGAADAIEAFQYYLTHLNHGRPYVLIGHSQGAMDLAMVLLMNGNIMPDHGFVAAYLIGLPFKINANGAKLPFAKNADDVGIVISWNTQSKDSKGSVFTGKGTYCINPLNWKTDATPATANENPGAMFYDYKTGKMEHYPNYCGAVIDPEKGALIADPPESKWTKETPLGKGVYHMNDLYFFYESLVNNVQRRVKNWRALYEKPQQ